VTLQKQKSFYMTNTNKNDQTYLIDESTPQKGEETSPHIPVLAREVLTQLDPKQGEKYLDATAGYGGHAALILERTLPQAENSSVLIDRDHYAVAYLRDKFARTPTQVLHNDYLQASLELSAKGAQFDIILADLGVSSLHLDMASRGFAIKADGPLDMRMDQRQALSAFELVNNYSEAELTDVIRRYGEEPRAGRIARAIVTKRPIQTTSQLAEVVAQAWPGYSKVHPATRTFQALRIAVNDELNMLQKALYVWKDLLTPGGRLGIITFHSLEDRIVKQFISEEAGDRYDAELRLVTKKPIVAQPDETAINPRARSAKLRVVAKNKNQKEGASHAN
jgi:16S rRNA (cytosine1402-N4)-methyltransferase